MQQRHRESFGRTTSVQSRDEWRGHLRPTEYFAQLLRDPEKRPKKRALHAPEKLCLLCLELFVRDRSLNPKPIELGNLIGDRRGGCSDLASRASFAHLLESTVVVLFLLVVDLRLHQVGLTNVGKRLATTFASALDTEISRPCEPFERGLFEEDGVDSVEGNLDARFRKNSLARDDSLGRDDELGRRPFGVALCKGEQDQKDANGNDDLSNGPDRSITAQSNECESSNDEHGEKRADRHHRPPVRMHVDDDLFVIS